MDYLDDFDQRNAHDLQEQVALVVVIWWVPKRLEVMYAGRVVEEGNVLDVFFESGHPYTRGLLNCLPRLDRPRFDLIPIEGAPPSPLALPSGCAFHPRCPFQREQCVADSPPLERHGPTASACHFAEEVRLVHRPSRSEVVT